MCVFKDDKADDTTHPPLSRLKTRAVVCAFIRLPESLYVLLKTVMLLWRYGGMALWCYGVMVLRRYGAMVLWRYGVMAVWRYGVMALWRYGVMMPCCYGAMVLWRYGAMALWRYGAGRDSNPSVLNRIIQMTYKAVVVA
jgi:hypothetical protein